MRSDQKKRSQCQSKECKNFSQCTCSGANFIFIFMKEENLDQISGISTSVLSSQPFLPLSCCQKKMKGTKNLSSLTIYSQNASVAFSNFSVRTACYKIGYPQVPFYQNLSNLLALMSSFLFIKPTQRYVHTLICTRFKVLNSKD